MNDNSGVELRRKIIFYRGKIINDTILLERIIDTFIAIYFTKDEPEFKDGKSLFTEMIELILSNERMSLGSKIEVFCYIVKKHYPQFLLDNPTLNKDLAFIIQQRNILAHYMFDTSDDYIAEQNSKFGFIKQKNKTETIEFDKARMKDVDDKIHQYLLAINNLTQTVGGISSLPLHPIHHPATCSFGVHCCGNRALAGEDEGLFYRALRRGFNPCIVLKKVYRF